ncbi:hypothetical protein LY76DRAFT_598664 [Colletotrichum caudatum]|nr:hypothetical protein LY76DRAFT_598664 [Colletotrichum caudatum]
MRVREGLPSWLWRHISQQMAEEKAFHIGVVAVVVVVVVARGRRLVIRQQTDML